MGKIVHFMIGTNVQAGLLQTVFDYLAKGRSGLRGFDEWLTLTVMPIFRSRIDRKSFSEHGALFAKSGHGKTQTLRAIIASFLQEHDPPALFIMDSLGSLIEGLDRLDVFTNRLKDRLVIIDPTDPTPPALNFFKLQSDDLCFYLFKAIDQSFTKRQATMISYLMELMRNISGATLLTLIEVCESKENPYPQRCFRRRDSSLPTSPAM